MVADEKGGIDDDAGDPACEPQADHTPIVTRLAAATRLPAVHPFSAVGVLPFSPDRPSGLDQILARRKEIVVGGNRPSSDALRREIDELSEIGHEIQDSEFKVPDCLSFFRF